MLIDKLKGALRKAALRRPRGGALARRALAAAVADPDAPSGLDVAPPQSSKQIPLTRDEIIAAKEKIGPDEAAEREQHARIAELCAAAGEMALAVSAIETGLSVADVEQLLDERGAERRAVDEKVAEATGRGPGTPAREAEILASWERAIARVAADMGIQKGAADESS